MKQPYSPSGEQTFIKMSKPSLATGAQQTDRSGDAKSERSDTLTQEQTLYLQQTIGNQALARRMKATREGSTQQGGSQPDDSDKSKKPIQRKLVVHVSTMAEKDLDKDDIDTKSGMLEEMLSQSVFQDGMDLVEPDQKPLQPPIWSYLSEKTVWEPRQIIDGIYIAGRPPGPFSGKEGSHTTAWAIFCDGVRNNVLGLTLAEAIDRMRLLSEDALLLPGMSRMDALDEKHKTFLIASIQHLFRTIEEADQKIESGKSGYSVQLLQQIIDGYLSFRNLIPLTQVMDGRSVGKGEPKHLKLLREVNNYESGWVSNGDGISMDEEMKGKVRIAMWDLLDAGAVRRLMSEMSELRRIPGVNDPQELPESRLTDVVLQHLFSVQNAYEEAFEASEMQSENSIVWFVTKRLKETESNAKNFFKLLDNGFKKSALTDKRQTTINDSRFKVQGPEGQSGFSVQIDIDQNGSVSDLRTEGRPQNLIKGTMGRHTTAWIVYIDSVSRTIYGYSMPEAMVRVNDMGKNLLSLPVVQRVKHMESWQQDRFQQAATLVNEYKGWSLSDFTKLAVEAWQPALQQLIAGYLSLCNVLPLSHASTGGLPDGNAEGYTRAQLHYLESDGMYWPYEDKSPPGKEQFADIIWKMLDTKAIKSFEDAEDQLYHPGFFPVDEHNEQDEHMNEYFLVTAEIIAHYLFTMRLAYPQTFNNMKMDSYKTIQHFLERKLDIIDFKIQNTLIALILKLL